MKNLFILLAISFFMENVFSQSLKILDTNNVDISGTTVNVSGTVSDGLVYFYAHIQNTSVQDIQTIVFRQVVYENGSAGNSFCFGPHCYTSDTANFPVTIVSGDIDSSFDATYLIADAGISQIIYTFYDKNNTSDKVSVTVNYDITTAIIAGNLQKNFLSKPYPVPASEFVNFDYHFDADAQLMVYDITGKVILRTILNPKQNQLKIPVKNFNSGIYYYSLLINKKKIITNKFIVN